MNTIIATFLYCIPGLVAASLYWISGASTKKSVLNFIYVMIVLGLFSYFVLAVVYAMLGRELSIPIFSFN